jgi:hypothetical protein
MQCKATRVRREAAPMPLGVNLVLLSAALASLLMAHRDTYSGGLSDEGRV